MYEAVVDVWPTIVGPLVGSEYVCSGALAAKDALGIGAS